MKIEIDNYEPDYDTKCEVCGQTPTVKVMKDGKCIEHMEMCGACVWGESACLNPDNW